MLNSLRVCQTVILETLGEISMTGMFSYLIFKPEEYCTGFVLDSSKFRSNFNILLVLHTSNFIWPIV